MSVLGGGSTYAGVPINELSENARTIKLIFEAPNLAEKLNTIVPSNYNAAAPKAHLNYLFFDDNLQLVADLSGKIQVSPNGAGTSGWQTVGTGTEICNCTAVAPGSSGYIAIYVDNQSLGKKVWFDDLHIEHYTSEVLEEDHYYPFGLTVGVGQTGQPGLPGQPYKYNGKVLEKSFGLEMYDYGARQYDPQIGRWMGVDPLADKFCYESPSVYAGNNPVRNIDVGGMFKVDGQTAKDYPIVKIMADRFLPGLKDNLEIKQAFLDNMEGKMTGQQFDEMVGRNSGLTIVAADENGTSRWDPNYPDQVFISKDLLQETQNAFDKAKNTGEGTDLMTSMFETSLSVLHESSHGKAAELGVKDMGQSTQMVDYERGFSFEEKAFGRKSTTTISPSTTIKVRDHDKVEKVAKENYGTTKGFGMTISGVDNNFYDKKKLGFKTQTSSTKTK
jgi:RHS repeat-associated protein